MSNAAELVGRAMDHRREGRPAQAESCLREALRLAPANLGAVVALADLLQQTDRGAEAEVWFRKAIALSPLHPQLYDHLALLVLRLGRPAEAEAVLREAVQRFPGNPATLRNLGMLVADSGRPDDGIPWLRQAVEREPANPGFRNDLGRALLRRGDLEDAETELRAALALRPDDVDFMNNVAACLRLQKRHLAAEQIYRDALQREPDSPERAAFLGGALREQGRVAEAKSLYRQALAGRSPWADVHSNLIFCLDFDGSAGLEEQQEERRRWRESVEAPLLAQNRHPFPAPVPGKKLRIGYASGDFNHHSASDMFGAVLLHHDLDCVDVVLYSSNQKEDERTARFASRATVFRRVRLLDDDSLAATIREDRIDILVDLSGHSAGNRLPVFARRPAPVQVTAWGYATGTGLASMDYFLADARLVPASLRSHFTERVFELSCFLSYLPPAYLPAVSALPMANGGGVTFGNLNRLSKASESCLEVWAGLLCKVPGSRLLLKCPSLDEAGARARTLEIFRRREIGQERLDLRGSSPHPKHLATYADIDIALDPFPHCGGTTSCEALMMGVPVVSLCGEVPVSRNGFALLGAIGFEEWVATDVERYQDIAAGLAADPVRLAAIRRTLRELVKASPIGDNRAYAREVEAAYRRIWLRHCIEAGATGLD